MPPPTRFPATYAVTGADPSHAVSQDFRILTIDQQHAWHSRDLESFKVDYHTRSIRGMHIYDSVIVFDKGQVSKPVHKKTGKPSF
jgi:hypothetical protein